VGGGFDENKKILWPRVMLIVDLEHAEPSLLPLGSRL